MGSGFWEMVAAEIRLRARSVTTYIFWAALLGLSVAIMSVDSSLMENREGGAYLNAPSSLAVIGVVMVALFATLISAISGTAIYRDFESNSHTLFFSTRLTKADYWFGRFVGSFLVTVLVFSAIPLGFLLGTVMPWAHKEIVGPFRGDAYFALFFHFILPDLFLIAALFFVAGALTRSLLAIYTQGIVLLVAWLVSAIISARIADSASREFASLFEPFGMSALYSTLRYWTVYEQNNLTIPFAGALLQNRLLWFGVAIVVLIGGYFVFDFSHAPRVIQRRAMAPLPPLQNQGDIKPMVRVAPVGWRYHAVTCWRLLGYYAREILRGIPFMIVTGAGVIMMLIIASEADTAFGTPAYPVTRVILESITDTFEFFFLALIFFYAGELVWRERVLRTDQITDSLPVSSATTLSAKIGAVLVMVGVLNLVLIATGILLQLGSSFTHIDLPLYFTWLYSVKFWDCVAIVFLAFFLHIVINQRFITYVVVVVLYIIPGALSEWGFSRKIVFYGEHPDFVYSDMNGFGPFLAPMRWHQFYWCAVGVLLLVLALKLIVRGTENGLKARWRSSQLGSGSIVVAGIAAVSFVGAGAFIFYNTDILNKYASEKMHEAVAARYEKDYKKRFEHAPQPRITAVTLDIALFPERQQYSMRGIYKLQNKTNVPISEILLDYDRDLKTKHLTWSVPTRIGIKDVEYGLRTYLLDKPLAPGAEITLEFELADEHRGFENEGAHVDIVRNGTFLTMPTPRIGYQEESEITDPAERRKHGLAARRVMAPVTDAAARQVTYVGSDADWIDFDCTVRTAPDQIALAPGYLQKKWMENGRRCFRYHMDAPIRNFYSILSARYTVKKDTWKAPDGKIVDLAVYYHPDHPYNVNRMLDGVKGALTYCSTNFSPYQFHQLRILEFPKYEDFAQSFPNTIPYSESIGFIARVKDRDEDLDYPFYVSAHETAHQWWAHQVLGANVEGSEMLSESLAEYSALMVIHHRYGMGYLRRFLRYDLDEYLKGRGEDTFGENPLVKAQHQQYIHYSKGSLVFCALAKRIGEKRLNAILARFVKDKKFQEPPYTTAEELVRYLKQGASETEKAYIRDLFENITIYDIHADKATRKREKDGTWTVKFTYTVKKYYADAKGKETPAPLNGEIFDVGLFAESNGDSSNYNIGKALFTTTYDANPTGKAAGSETMTATLTRTSVKEKPIYAGIDPYNVMIDRKIDNNVIEITDAK